ncbi:DUF3696 domain-containing protein [Hydrogenophaga sp.]|uniref:DUF3696 domain-containing protein n=1 Tax=Hydrogenophaga sp. TaxID=1904254 RepID=UPI003F710271
MRITVENFKGIARIEDFCLEQISILAGTNSGGKSSLVQLLMLLKQSLEARSPETPLKLNKPYISLGRFENVIRRSPGVKSFKVAIVLERADLDERLLEVFAGKRRVPGLLGTELADVKEVRVVAEFKKPTNRIVVSSFEIEIIADRNISLTIARKSHGKSHTLKTNADQFFFRRIKFKTSGIGSQEHPSNGGRSYDGKVGYTAFFPLELDIEPSESEYVSFSPLMNYIRNSLHSAFERISYIGPLREEPKEFYYHDDDLIDHIGNKGENAAFLLSKHAEDHVQYIRFGMGTRAEAIVRNGNLKEAVNYWLCEVFGLAKEVRVTRAKTNRHLYSVSLKGWDGGIVPITHVGFGVSQIFPILVEGLRSTPGRRIIILEQPEIHLHPKVQSWLFDFVRSVSNVSFLVETHSDHFINRLRRRVAEDESNSLADRINLTFVNPSEEGTNYERLKLFDTGSLAKWPVGFFDQYDEDVRALVRAQADRRKNLPAE